jgi:hypothetical protein
MISKRTSPVSGKEVAQSDIEGRYVDGFLALRIERIL